MMALVMEHLTSANVSLVVAAVLFAAGALHALPGPTLHRQAKEMDLPAWFIMCAGILMLGSSVTWFMSPALGVYAVALCMGGSVATAAKMPKPMQRPGGLVGSNATLAAAIWALHERMGGLTLVTGVMCSVAYIAGIAGRLYVPTHPLAIKLFGSLSGKAKEDHSEEIASTRIAKKEKLVDAPVGGTPSREGDAKENNAPVRKRVASPEPPRGKLVEANVSS